MHAGVRYLLFGLPLFRWSPHGEQEVVIWAHHCWYIIFRGTNCPTSFPATQTICIQSFKIRRVDPGITPYNLTNFA